MSKNESLGSGIRIPPGEKLQPPEIEAENSIADKVKSARLDLSKEPPEPEPVISVNEKAWGTLGNFSLLIGKAKSGKTMLNSVIMAVALGEIRQESWKGEIQLAGNLPEGKKQIIYFDTEQGEHHVWKTAVRVLQLARQNKNHAVQFEVYKLRAFNTEERRKIIEYVILNTEGIGLIVIDGIRDLVTSINDEREATFIGTWLLKLTDEFGIHIITVLHQNKGKKDKNARGHLGTELVNKAETTVSVSEKSAGLRIVEVEYCRDVPFEPFHFRINEEGIPEYVSAIEAALIEPKKKEKSKKFDPAEIDAETHREHLKKVFSEDSELTRANLQSRICNEYDRGDTLAKRIINYLLDENILYKKGTDGSRNVRYSNKPFNAE